jgi:hypothetical protein
MVVLLSFWYNHDVFIQSPTQFEFYAGYGF